VPLLEGRVSTISGTAGPDSLTGGSGADTIDGLDGNDTVDGGAGDDIVFAYSGADVALGGDGDDALFGADGDQLSGGLGRDTVSGNFAAGRTGSLTLEGGGGDDQIGVNFDAPGSSATVRGGEGADAITISGAGVAQVDAGAGDDVVEFYGGASSAVVSLGPGSDTLKVRSQTQSLPGAVTVADFVAGPGGDHIEVFDYLHTVSPAWTPATNPFAAGLLRLLPANGSTILQMNVAGVWRDVFTLQGVAPGSLTADNLGGFAPNSDSVDGRAISGTPGPDSIAGGAGPDTLDGSAGDDTLAGGPGDDRINGGDGGDSVTADAGSDTVRGGAGADTITDLEAQYGGYYGDDGADRIQVFQRGFTPPGDLTVDGGAGDDYLSVTAASVWTQVDVRGGEGADQIEICPITLSGASGRVDAGDGNDRVVLSGWIGDLEITLGPGTDFLEIANAHATRGVAIVRDFDPTQDGLRILSLSPDGGGLSGGFAQGTLRLAQSGSDTLLQVDLFTTTSQATWVTAVRFVTVDARALQAALGMGVGTIPNLSAATDPHAPASPPPTAGPDSLTALPGAAEIHAGAGADTIYGGLAPDYLRGDDGDDSLVGGAAFDDINGNTGNDTAYGGRGDDWVVGGKDDDLLFGDTGNDLVYGNLGRDTCNGGDGNDIVRGGQDNDLVGGGAGDDFVSGDKGDDTMAGGPGADVFHSFGDAGVDRVTDFSLSQGDRVVLDPGTSYTVAQAGADTVITMGGGGHMILVGVAMSSLTGAWIGVG
jgi:Ca2+-binding RTX toxin-like protein